MSRPLVWSPRATKKLKKLDRTLKKRIVDAVENLATDGTGDVKRLQGEQEGQFRLRVGDWRVILEEDEDGAIHVVEVGVRGDIYK